MRASIKARMIAVAVVVAVSGVVAGLPFVGAGAEQKNGDKPHWEDGCAKVKDVASHAFNGEEAFMYIRGKKKLCEPLYVVGASFEYVNPKPDDGTSGRWPQKLVAKTKTKVVRYPGEYKFYTRDVCGQRDIYAALNEAPKVPDTMEHYGDNEPLHLHQFSNGVITYEADDPAECVDSQGRKWNNPNKKEQKPRMTEIPAEEQQ